MGKPFEGELKALPETYLWAASQPIGGLSRAVGRLLAAPLMAVGSGGSFTACHFACHLHEAFAQQPAVPLPPLQAVDERTPSSQMSVLVPTAGGNNPDVVAAVRRLAEVEPRSMLIVCGDPESRVAELARRYRFIDFAPFQLPAGKDGFLATNSLVAFCVLLARAYGEVAGCPSVLPKTLRALLPHTDRGGRVLSSAYQAILDRNTLVVLHGPSTRSAAVDIESKFTEAALGAVQIADYRQFAHGRHHWIAKNPTTTAVLSLESADDVDLATQTLSFLPESIPVKRIGLAARGPVADLAAIIEGFRLTETAGRARGIDPGRPGVPAFGRKLYHANAFPRIAPPEGMAPWKVRAIERKTSHSLKTLLQQGQLASWRSSLEDVLEQIAAARFWGIVFDYDGTLCHEDQRFEPLSSDVVQALTDLLSGGMILGVATGRGKSVRERLREAIPKKRWSQVLVGYYNGGELFRLNDPGMPNGEEGIGPELAKIALAVQSDRLLAQGRITRRRRQITVSEVRGLSLQALCAHAEAIADHVGENGVRVMRSGHSVDIVPDSVTKLAVVEGVQQLAGHGLAPVLRIGDRGQWPGNDAQLLASPFGLSSHEVSSDGGGCWNLAAPGHRGPQATLGYLQQLSLSKHGLRYQSRRSG